MMKHLNEPNRAPETANQTPSASVCRVFTGRAVFRAVDGHVAYRVSGVNFVRVVRWLAVVRSGAVDRWLAVYFDD